MHLFLLSSSVRLLTVLSLIVVTSLDKVQCKEISSDPIEAEDKSGISSISPEESKTKYPILIPTEIVTESGDSLVKLYEEELLATQPGSELPKKGRIDSSGYNLRNCGDVKEKCFDEDLLGVSGQSPSIGAEGLLGGSRGSSRNFLRESLTRPKDIDYLNKPFYCRCDNGTCDEYGDCCWTIAKTLLYQNPWRCHKVQHEYVWALMISKCPDSNSPHRLACESPELLPKKKYSYLHDLPIYNNGSGQLFRNIFCAECNGVSNREIYPMRVRLMCSQNFTGEELKGFMSRATYQPGRRIWINDKKTLDKPSSGKEEDDDDDKPICAVFVPQLDHQKLDLRWTIPNIRFCRREAIESCPKEYSLEHPLIAGLCQSYTQYVNNKLDQVYKNPHCAKCHGINRPDWELRCLHDRDIFGKGQVDPPSGSKMTPGQVGAELGSAGLSLLFAFDLGMEESYVGWETKCPGDMMWDFVRQNCTPTQCGQGYRFDSQIGICLLLEDHLDDPKKKNQDQSLGSERKPNNASSCLVIILSKDEYHLLPNESILVNQTTKGAGAGSKTLIFHPGEYSIWNASSISICARDLSSAFISKFSPLLNYISLSALGISVFFSFAHILIFLIIPQMRNLPGKNLFCLTLSLFISQGIFLIFIENESPGICIGAAISSHYFFLASFFWMNILSFDLWRTFSGEFMKRRAGSNDHVGSTFIKYSIYAWISPGLFVSASSLIDFLVAKKAFFNQDDNYSTIILDKIRPLYGHNNVCWISQGLSLFLFFALPAAILISINIILFTITAKAIRDQSNESQRVFSQKGKVLGGTGGVAQGQGPGDVAQGQISQKEGAEIDRMKLYGKLGLIMGLTWSLGFLSGVSGWEWLWYPFVIFNGLQGTFIFFSFDVKMKVWGMLRERLDCQALNYLKKGPHKGYPIQRRDTNTSTTVVANSIITPTFRNRVDI